MTLDEYRQAIGTAEFWKHERRSGEDRRSPSLGAPALGRRKAETDRRITVYAVRDTPDGITTERIK